MSKTVLPLVRDLGGFSVRRVLPALECRSIGPFVFFDEMGPLTVKTGLELEVRPHPHIGLATLTWLFDGAIMHRDSLGSVQVIHPGAVNLMTAGAGIVHSERASQAGLKVGDRIHGAQFWLALPKADEERAPSFAHHPAESIPEVRAPGVTGRVVIGEWMGVRSPVVFPHPALCVDVRVEAGKGVELPSGAGCEELGVYVVEGRVRTGGMRLGEGTMWVEAGGPSPAPASRVLPPSSGRGREKASPASGLLQRTGEDGATAAASPALASRALPRSDRRGQEILAVSGARLLIIAGAPLDGPRHLDWNFVSSSRERLERAKQDWQAGRFPPVPGETEHIPYP